MHTIFKLNKVNCYHQQGLKATKYFKRAFINLKPPNPFSSKNRSNSSSVIQINDNIKIKQDVVSYEASKRTRFTASQVYQVVSDINQYSKFVPWCTHSTIINSRILKSSEHPSHQLQVLEAELAIGYAIFYERYISKVTCKTNEYVKAENHDSRLFKNLCTIWTFKDLEEIQNKQDHSLTQDILSSQKRSTPSQATTTSVAAGNSWYTPTTIQNQLEKEKSVVQIKIDFEFQKIFFKQFSQLYLETVAVKSMEAFELRCQQLF